MRCSELLRPRLQQRLIMLLDTFGQPPAAAAATAAVQGARKKRQRRRSAGGEDDEGEEQEEEEEEARSGGRTALRDADVRAAIIKVRTRRRRGRFHALCFSQKFV